MRTYKARIPLFQNTVAKDLLQLMHEKETNLALSLDVTEKSHFLEIADQIGKEICVLKTHIDIIDDCDQAFISRLLALAEKHRFIIFEDRKFADIGNTVKTQYAKGIYKIADWARLTNAHTLSGPGIIDALKSVGMPRGNALLLLAQMSANANLMTPAYTQKTLDFANLHRDFVIGFIAQKRLTDHPDFLYFTPGICLDTKTDGQDQRYRTPQAAILDGTDVMIVGRGILRQNYKIAAQKYRAAGWGAYLERIAQKHDPYETGRA